MPEPLAAQHAHAACDILPAPRSPASAAGLARLILLWLLRGAERARSRRDLARMDARLLRDIGLSSQERDQELAKWWWRS